MRASIRIRSAIAALGLAATIAAPAAAAPVQFLDARDIQLSVASDNTNLTFFASTPDEAANSTGFRIFDLNIGLNGNAAAWRYRLSSQNNQYLGSNTVNPSAPFSGPSANGWQGYFQKGNDSIVDNAMFGIPGGLVDLDVTQIVYSVFMNGGRREHEIAIPWTLLLDGQNGWDFNTTFALRVAGFYGGTVPTNDGVRYSFGGNLDGSVDFGVQSTYALANVPAPIPLPATAWLLLSGVGALVGMRRFRRAAT